MASDNVGQANALTKDDRDMFINRDLRRFCVEQAVLVTNTGDDVVLLAARFEDYICNGQKPA